VFVNVMFRVTVDGHTSISPAGTHVDEMPAVGDEIEVGGSKAIVEKLGTAADGTTFIVATRVD
jgi:hypothetical protein